MMLRANNLDDHNSLEWKEAIWQTWRKVQTVLCHVLHEYPLRIKPPAVLVVPAAKVANRYLVCLIASKPIAQPHPLAGRAFVHSVVSQEFAACHSSVSYLWVIKSFVEWLKSSNARGVVSNFRGLVGTGGGRCAQNTPNITFSTEVAKA